MKKNRKTSGIQRRYLKYTAALLGLALLLSSVGVIISVRNRLTRSIIDKYEFMTERMGLTLENMYRKSDETTAECILYDDVQQSLKNQYQNDTGKERLCKTHPKKQRKNYYRRSTAWKPYKPETAKRNAVPEHAG